VVLVWRLSGEALGLTRRREEECEAPRNGGLGLLPDAITPPAVAFALRLLLLLPPTALGRGGGGEVSCALGSRSNLGLSSGLYSALARVWNMDREILFKLSLASSSSSHGVLGGGGAPREDRDFRVPPRPPRPLLRRGRVAAVP